MEKGHNTTVKEVWISSISHNSKFSALHQQTSFIRKMLGLYQLPPGFPFLKIKWQRIPIVYEKRCSLDILADRLVFSPRETKGVISYYNVDTHFEATILFRQITSIATYKNPNPPVKMYNIEWIVLKYTEDYQEKEMLFCVGGKLLKTIREETKAVRDQLLSVV